MPAVPVAHGGVLLAVHRGVPSRKLELRTCLQAVAARILFDHRSLTVCSVYLPPGNALPRLELSRLIAELPPPMLILGDFNGHHTLWGCKETDARGRVLERLILEESLAILNTGTRTHVTMPSGATSALDLSLSSPQLMPLFKWQAADDPMGSDHFPVLLNYNSRVSIGSRPQRWNIRKADWDKFEAEVEQALSTDASDHATVEDLTGVILCAARKSIPRTSGKPSRTPVPWWSKECQEAIRARRRAFRAFDGHATTENLIAFRQARASARRVILEAKRLSWRRYVEKLNRFSPVSQVWSQIKQISGRFSAPSLPVLRVHGQDVLHPLDVANEIGRAFADRCGTANADPLFLQHKRRTEAGGVDFSTAEELAFNQPFSLSELKSAISGLRSVSEGPDEIHNEMLKHLPTSALQALLAAFNRLWERGEFPEAWREAIVVPLLKPGKSGTAPLDYRPISLTSSLCKLMERLVNVRLAWYLESQNILTPAQCGFRKNRSAVDHLVTLDTVVRLAFKERRHVGAVFFDLEGAYDTTWRHGILLKAFKCGIRGAMGNFIRNFLHERFFRVRVGDQLSERFLQENGVPQGGVLSVALFALAINDVGDVLPHSIGRSLFVDDFAIWCSSLSTPSMERRLQMAVTRLEGWARLNGFRFSTTKTKAMHFCRRRGNCPGVPLRLYGEVIPLESSVRFLGVQLDRRLTYQEHLKSLRLKCTKAMNILKCVSRTTYGSDRATLLLLYRSLIRSKLDYACVVYDSACATHKRTLDIVHNAALRIVTGAFRTSPVSSILVEAHEPPLSLRRSLLSIRYACKLRQLREHPTYNKVFSRSVLATFRDGRPPRAVPFCLRVRELLLEADINVRRIAPIAPSRIPPWLLSVASIDMSLVSSKKRDTPVLEWRSMALERIAYYDNHVHFYTDGSKTEDGVGCAFVSGVVTRSFTLHSRATVFTSELVAIEKALCFMEVSSDVSFVIFTDSLSSLLALSDFNTSHPVVQSILTILTSLDRAGKAVVFCWMPSHIGVAGNDRADEAAKRAARSRCTRFLPLPASDFFPACLSHLRNKWQEEWDTAGSSKLKSIKPRLAHWPSSLRKNRREEVALCRLRIGHTLTSHRYLLSGGPKPRCPRCNGFLSVTHVLVSCRGLDRIRKRFLGSSSLTLADLLSDDSTHISNVMKFIHEVQFPVIYQPSISRLPR